MRCYHLNDGSLMLSLHLGLFQGLVVLHPPAPVKTSRLQRIVEDGPIWWERGLVIDLPALHITVELAWHKHGAS